ncbi:MAG: hypothetical protein J0H18_14600 [Rhizobiales bacterium]|nr:hypothetical protein [Hyphomicrobiales bacterium]OJX99451.1 MAG: hypothetical protein BGP07_05395 [Rhizobiales bacterium 63-22]
MVTALLHGFQPFRKYQKAPKARRDPVDRFTRFRGFVFAHVVIAKPLRTFARHAFAPPLLAIRPIKAIEPHFSEIPSNKVS